MYLLSRYVQTMKFIVFRYGAPQSRPTFISLGMAYLYLEKSKTTRNRT